MLPLWISTATRILEAITDNVAIAAALPADIVIVWVVIFHVISFAWSSGSQGRYAQPRRFLVRMALVASYSASLNIRPSTNAFLANFLAGKFFGFISHTPLSCSLDSCRTDRQTASLIPRAASASY